MTRPLAVLVPSRGRPHSLDRLATAFADTHHGFADLVVIADSDESRAYEAEADRLGLFNEPWFEFHGQAPARLAPTINHWAPVVLANEIPSAFLHEPPTVEPRRHVGFIGDDHIPRTPGWDRRVVDTLDGMDTGIVYTNDLIHGEGLATAMFYHGSIVRALGRMTPPDMVHLYLDNAAMALGRALDGLVYLGDVVIEHMHPLVGKGEHDATYAAANAGDLYETDSARFNAWLADSAGLTADVATVRTYLALQGA